ncbi:Superkiller protein 3 [Cryptotrichosporon argae]
MSTKAAKDAFKAIAASIKSNDPETALGQATKLLKTFAPDGPDAAQALLYRALALDKLERSAEAEKAYVHAFRLNPTSQLAYAATCKALRKAERWGTLGRVIETRTQAAVDSDDAETCAAALQDLVELRAAHGSEDQLFKALSLLLPSSPLYGMLQRLTLPADTYVPLSKPPYPIDKKPIPPLPSPLPHVLHLSGSLPLLLHLLLRRQAAIHAAVEAEVKVRRQRIGAKSEKDVRAHAEREALAGPAGAELVALLREVASHPGADDALRRQAEVDEFQFWQRLTLSLSPNDAPPAAPATHDAEELPIPPLFQPLPDIATTKEEARQRTDRLAQGFVVLGAGGVTEDAWTWLIEGRDEPTIYYDLELLHKFAKTFPTAVLTDFIDDYCRWFKLPLPEPDEEPQETPAGAEGDGQPAGKPKKQRWRKKTAAMNARERRKARRQAEREGQLAEDLDREEREELVAAMTKLVGRLTGSLFAQRVMARVYIQEEDWQNAIEYAENTRKLLTVLEAERGIALANVRCSADQALAVALVPYFAPKHHARADRLLKGVLKAQPENYEARFTRSQIFQAAGNWVEARKGFQLLVGKGTEAESLAAQEEVAWCLDNEGKLQDARAMLLDVVKAVRDAAPEKQGEEEKQDPVGARTWWRLGQAEWKSTGVCFAASSPPDEDRALMCFQKAFELDATETEAAHRLASGYALQDEWSSVRTIATRVMSGEGGVEGVAGGSLLEATGRFAPKNGWAWKALGSTEMHYKNFVKAAQAFQIALRADPDDVSLWLLLGRAYVKSGKHVAGLKALQRALELDAGSWLARYHLAELHIQLGAFDESLDELDRAAALAPDAGVGIKAALAGALLLLGRSSAASGFRERSRRALRLAIDAATDVLVAGEQQLWAWKIIGDAAFDLAAGEADVSDTTEATNSLMRALQFLTKVDTQGVSAIAGLGSASDLLGQPEPGSTHKAAILIYAYRAHQLAGQTRTIDPALFDLASACHALASTSTDPSVQTAAIKAAMSVIRLALNHDATDERLWNAMGAVAAGRSAQLAQHAFVVSLECYNKDPAVWTNLGYLYLEAGDTELAADCFVRAQTLDPEYAAAWLGQGLVARANGDVEQTRNLLSHAVTLSAGSLLEADLALAVTIFDRHLSAKSMLHQPTFALRHYTHARPTEAFAQHLYALFCERLGLHDEAAAALARTVELYERAFEATESFDDEWRYTVSLANLGRASLAAGAYDRALTAYTVCAEFVAHETRAQAVALRAQVQLGIALAHYWLGDLDASLAAFQAALDAAADPAAKDDVAVKLTRTLWNVGGDDARETAKSNMLDSLAHEHPGADVVATVGALAILTSDADLVEAALAELHSLPPAGLAHVVLFVHALVEGRQDDALGVLETAVVSDPADARAKVDLARALLALGEAQGADEALAGFRTSDARLAADADVARGTARVLDADKPEGRAVERAVMLAPWEAGNWAALAYVRQERAGK